MKKKVSVLGAGSWGNTLAILLCDKFDVTMWEFDAKVAGILASDRENKKFLPEIRFPENLSITNDLSEAIKDSYIIVFAVPSFAIRSLSESSKELINNKQIIVSVTKGIEDGTFMRMTEIIDNVVKNKKGVVALSGP